MSPAYPERLDSWKTIAEYLGRNVRTAMRWAQERGLPVHRVPGGKRGAVFAFRADIDGWLVNQQGSEGDVKAGITEGDKSGVVGAEIFADSGFYGDGGKSKSAGSSVATTVQPLEPLGGLGDSKLGQLAFDVPVGHAGADTRLYAVDTRAWNWKAVLPTVLVLIAVAIGVSVEVRAGRSEGLQPYSVTYGFNTLEAKSVDGRTIWTHKFSQTIRHEYLESIRYYSQVSAVDDYFADHTDEVAAIVPFPARSNDDGPPETEVDFFDSGGRLLWRYAPQKKYQFGDHELEGPWSLREPFAVPDGLKHRLWVIGSHDIWGNSFVAELDPRSGKDKVRFVNTGVLYSLNEVRAGGNRYLLASGFNNEWDGGSLAIINENREFAASPQTPGTRHKCNSCPPGEPDYYFVFPRTEINQISRDYEDPILNVMVTMEGIEFTKRERIGLGPEGTIYLLNSAPPFRLLSVRYNSNYDMLHREWSAQGKIEHSLENCPERLHPKPVRLWTPAGGWVDVPVQPASANQ